MTRNVYALILAGGSGTRVGGPAPKQFLPLGERPLIRETMARFEAVKEVTALILVVPSFHMETMKEILERYPARKDCRLVEGGATRQQSAFRGLTARDFSPDDIILIHDAARPFVSPEKISTCIEAAETGGGAGLYLPATDTITEIHDRKVTAIPEREHLYYTQTPQAFRYDLIKSAHEHARRNPEAAFTDDVSMVLAAGGNVQEVPGDPRNIKVTTPLDYDLACWMLEREKKS